MGFLVNNLNKVFTIMSFYLLLSSMVHRKPCNMKFIGILSLNNQVVYHFYDLMWQCAACWHLSLIIITSTQAKDFGIFKIHCRQVVSVNKMALRM